MTLTDLFTELANGLTSLATGFANIFSGITPIFWTAGTGAGEGSLTIVSVLLIGGVAITIGFWAIDKIFSLAKMGMSGLSKGRAKRSRRGS